MSLTLLYMVIARSLSDAAISQKDSFASLGMTNVRLFKGQNTSFCCKSLSCATFRATIFSCQSFLLVSRTHLQ
jgi:hypothetical protein